MEVDIGASTIMLQSLFGLDEYLWPVEQEQNKDNQIELNHGLSKMDVDVRAQQFNTTFEDSNSLFDNEWMTTKFDFSSVLDGPFDATCNQESNDLLSEVPDADSAALVESVIQSSTDTSGSSHSNVTSPGSVSATGESTLEDDCPASPEQHVPNADTSLENLDVKDLIELIMASGKASLADQKFSLNLDTMKRDQFYPVDKTPIPGEVLIQPEKSSFKIKTKTSEQKQRKKLQNRNAATRYRCKKRSEQDMLSSQCTELESENNGLHKKIASLQEETKYLKNLIIDVFQNKADKKKADKKKADQKKNADQKVTEL